MCQRKPTYDAKNDSTEKKVFEAHRCVQVIMVIRVIMIALRTGCLRLTGSLKLVIRVIRAVMIALRVRC